MAQLLKVDPASINFQVISWIQPNTPPSSFPDKASTPHSVRRLSDGEVFTIGDYVSNETKMRGHILRFEVFKQQNSEELHMFVVTDWSEVGMGLDDIYKLLNLPSQFQFRQVVVLNLNGKAHPATVMAVHFYERKVKYDLDVWLDTVPESSTRMYNIDSVLLSLP